MRVSTRCFPLQSSPVIVSSVDEQQKDDIVERLKKIIKTSEGLTFLLTKKPNTSKWQMCVATKSE